MYLRRRFCYEMVRNYKRKTEGPSWSKETLSQAMDAVKAGMSVYDAARIYNIPRKTIIDRVSGRRGSKSSTRGRPPAFSAETEKKLVEYIKDIERHGIDLSRKEVQELVGDYVKKNNLNTPFTNGIPGKDWFYNFITRHTVSIEAEVCLSEGVEEIQENK